MRRHIFRLIVVIGLVAPTGCASPNSDAGERPASRATGLTLTVVSPTPGETVQVPFEIRVTSNVDLGRVSTGKYHFHFWFDNNTSDYNMIEANSGTVTSAPTGPHTLHVTLNYADHSATGVEVAVKINIAPAQSGTAAGA